jgi:hypothetical protein
MRTLSQALEIIFEEQRKRFMKKYQKEKYAFQFMKPVFFLFPSLWTPLTFKSHNFLISYSL